MEISIRYSIADDKAKRGEPDVVREILYCFRLHTSLYHKTLCGALLEFQPVKPGGQGRNSLPWVCCTPFCRLTGKDRPFQAADDVLSAAFCDTHFRGMEQRAHSIVLSSVF